MPGPITGTHRDDSPVQTKVRLNLQNSVGAHSFERTRGLAVGDAKTGGFQHGKIVGAIADRHHFIQGDAVEGAIGVWVSFLDGQKSDLANDR